jgi:peptidoglycan/xylan/chitin deacetylase (PgdA/CDA1 family)
VAARRRPLDVAGPLLRSTAFARLAGFLEGATPAGRLAVLTYHRVDEPDGAPLLYPGLLSATPAEFEEQMLFVATRYRPISLADLLEVRRGRASLPRRAVLVTFDDAYRDFAKHAWPRLRRLGVPVTLFVATAYPDRPVLAFWWDRLWAALALAPPGAQVGTPDGQTALATEADRMGAYRSLRRHLKTLPDGRLQGELERLVGRFEQPATVSSVLGWDELRALAGEGVALAPHTRTHPLLDRVPRERVREEIVGSLEDLEREIGTVRPVLAYPSGGLSDSVVDVVREVGFELAFSTRRGNNRIGRADWLRLRRLHVSRRFGFPAVRAQLLPWWDRLGA